MNEVDFLLERGFDNLNFKEKLEVKQLGAHQPQHIAITQMNGKSNRGFKASWFSKKKWLTVSIQKKALFCFPCLLFGGDGTWSRTGYRDLKHLSERIGKHESSGSHLDNAVKLAIFGKVKVAARINDAYRRSTDQHNKQVEENRYVLSRIITCIQLCGKCETALRGHGEWTDNLNPEIFRCIFETMCESDSRLQRHYDAEPIFKGTSNTVHNELLDCMYEVYREEIAKQVDETSFVAVQAEETTNVSFKSQIAVVLRYVLPDNTVTERFWEFLEVKDKTELGISNSIKAVLEPLKLRDKLIAQTYDGAAVTNIHEVQKLMKETYPHAHFVHCYAHQLSLTLQQHCSARLSVLKVFFADLTAFDHFFCGSPKRAAALERTTQKRVPRPHWPHWAKSKPANAVWENRAALLQCMEDIRTQPGWDEATISEAYGLSKKLRDRAFLQLLEFFSLLMPKVDAFHRTLLKRNIDAPGISKVLANFKENVQKLRQRADELAAAVHDGADEPGRHVTNTAAAMKGACDAITSHVEHRFSQSDYLIAAKLLDCALFPQFASFFPTFELNCAVKLWPGGNEEKLKAELTTLYRHTELHTGETTLSLLASIHENNLQEAFAETVRLLRLVITAPMMTSETKRTLSTLAKIKAFTRNATGHPRLNALAMLCIESQLLQQLHHFTPKVIERFAQRKNRRAAFQRQHEGEHSRTDGSSGQPAALVPRTNQREGEDNLDLVPSTRPTTTATTATTATARVVPTVEPEPTPKKTNGPGTQSLQPSAIYSIPIKFVISSVPPKDTALMQPTVPGLSTTYVILPDNRPQPEVSAVTNSEPVRKRAKMSQPDNPPTQPVNPPSQPVNPPSQPVNPPTQPVNPPSQPESPPSQPVNSLSQPDSPLSQPVSPLSQPVNPPSQPVNPPSQPDNPPKFDPVHVTKCLQEKLRKLVMNKDNTELVPWVKSITHHFWWSCQTSDGNVQELKCRWMSILQHICGIHTWQEDGKERTCYHGNDTEAMQGKTKWLKKDSAAFKALSGLVLNFLK